MGLVKEGRAERFLNKQERLNSARSMLNSATYTPSEALSAGIQVKQDGTKRRGMDLLAFPDVSFEDIVRLNSGLDRVAPEIALQMEREAIYAHYIERQGKEVEALRKDEHAQIPKELDFSAIEGLSSELKAKLQAVRPQNLGQASRIDGMTPAALALLLAKTRRLSKSKRA